MRRSAYGAKIASQHALNGDSLKYDNTVPPAFASPGELVAAIQTRRGFVTKCDLVRQ